MSAHSKAAATIVNARNGAQRHPRSKPAGGVDKRDKQGWEWKSVQMARVCEHSDIILYVVDTRNPLFHFSRAMYDDVVNDLHKPLVLVLSKTDLSDPETFDRWEAYLRTNHGVTGIVRFSAFSGLH